MRTTVDLSEDAYHLVKAYAESHHLSLGKAMSEMILRKRVEPYSTVSEAGFPQLKTRRVMTPELVAEILSED